MDPNIVADSTSILLTPDYALKPETMGWFLKDTWLPATPEEEEYFYSEGLHKERSAPDPGSLRRVRDCLLSSGIPSEATDPFSKSPPGVTSYLSPFIDDDDSWPKDILSIKEEPVETDEEIEVSEPTPSKCSTLDVKVESSSSSDDDLVVDDNTAKEIADPNASIIWLTNPCDNQANRISPDINNQQQVVLAKRQSTRQRKPTYPSDIWSSSYYVRSKSGNNLNAKKMTAALVPAKTQVVNNNFMVTKPKWNRTTTTNNQQQHSNVSKILVFASPRKTLDLREDVKVPTNSNRDNNQPEWTAENKSVFPSKSVLKMNIGTRKKCADHNIKERARRSYIQSRFQELKEILGLKVTSSKLNVLKESVVECQLLQSKTMELDANWKECYEKNQALQSKFRKLKMASSKIS